MLYTAHYQSPAGSIWLAAEEDALVGLWIENQKYFLASIKEQPTIQEDHPVLMQSKSWLDRYFAGERPKISELKLAPKGSEFRQAVWELLCQIPYGELTTYGEIAKKIASKFGRERMSAQAVGGAVGHNPISIIIPCHRVVGTNGSLTGYAGGLDKKIWLLTHEGVDMDKLFVPKRGTAL
jgi:methylated-DNA-[protein]-cysteine S-methyltransferase